MGRTEACDPWWEVGKSMYIIGSPKGNAFISEKFVPQKDYKHTQHADSLRELCK